MTAPCPICAEPGGFHLAEVHAQHEVPRELLLETGWHKEAHEKIKREHAAKVAAIAERVVEEHAEILARLAAGIDEDKQAWAIETDAKGYQVGEPFLVKGTKPLEIRPGDIVIDPNWMPA